MAPRGYRIALALSLTLNVVLIVGIALYLHFAWLFDLVETAVGVVN